MNIIIVGAGKVGTTLVKQLSPHNRITVIDSNPQLIDEIINVYDVMAVCGNGARCAVQQEAGAERADLLIATASSDEINILACLVAKKLGVAHTIARVRNPEYEEQLRFMKNELGLSMAVNPEKAAAREIARVLRFPTAIKVESFSKGRLELVEYRLADQSPLDGMRLMDLYKNIHTRVLICAVTRGADTVIPSGNFTLQAGDKIYVTASPDQLSQFFQHLGVFRKRASSVIIVGASKTGYYLAVELLKMNMSVKIIDMDEQRCLQTNEQLPKALVITGDGTDSELLREEGIEQTDAFVALTGIDEANILMAMSVARQAADCKVVVKINRSTLTDLVSRENIIDCVISARAITADLIVQYIRSMQDAAGSTIKTLHHLVEGAVEAMEFHITAELPFVDRPLKELRLKPGILIAGIVRQNGTIVIPNGDDSLMADDDVILVTADPRVRDIGDILQ